MAGDLRGVPPPPIPEREHGQEQDLAEANAGLITLQRLLIESFPPVPVSTNMPSFSLGFSHMALNCKSYCLKGT
jgi:hypothetical protein